MLKPTLRKIRAEFLLIEQEEKTILHLDRMIQIKLINKICAKL